MNESTIQDLKQRLKTLEKEVVELKKQSIPISIIEQIKKEILNKENYSIGSELYMNGELFDADISVGVVLEIIDKHIKEYTDE